MKRIISILLSVLIVFTSFSGCISAFAFECEHDWFYVNTFMPSCDTDGYDLYSCKNCGEEIKNNIQPATNNHSYLNGVCKNCAKKDENYKIDPKPISFDEEIEFTTTQVGEYTYALFTPSEDGYYDVIGLSNKKLQLKVMNDMCDSTYSSKGYYTSNVFDNKYPRTVHLYKDKKYIIQVNFDGNTLGELKYKITTHKHSFKRGSYKSANCSNEGYAYYSCNYCSYSYSCLLYTSPSPRD